MTVHFDLDIGDMTLGQCLDTTLDHGQQCALDKTCKAPFTIGARPLYNTLRSKYFRFARPVAYVARSLAFVASVLVVASE